MSSMEQPKNYAFVDGKNLYLGIRELDWKLDYKRFRVYLKEKYGVEKAYMFMGFLPTNQELYNFLQTVGFVLIFKPILQDNQHPIKGNCDADLVLQVTRDAYESKFERAVLISSDGDYASLVKFLQERNRLRVILSPHTKEKCSILLKRTNAPITYLNDVRSFFERGKEKAPDADGTA